MRVLWLSMVWPWPLDSGGRIRSFQTLEAVAGLADEVTVVATADPGTDPDDLRRALPNVRVVDPIIWRNQIRRRPALLARALTSALRTGQPYRTAKYDCPPLASLAAGEIAGHDLLYVNCLGTAFTVGALRRRGVVLPPIVFEAHNVEHRVADDFARSLRGLRRCLRPALAIDARRTRRAEADFLEQASSVVTLSEQDAEALTALGAERVVVVPPGAWPIVPRATLGKDVLVLGNLHWLPTASALTELLPSLAAIRTDAEKLVVGGGATQRMRTAIGGAGLTYLGHVEDLEPVWHGARVVIVPGGGSGVRLRFLEAFRHGVPVVATRDSASGLADDGGALVVVHPNDIGGAVEAVLLNDDLARSLGEQGRRAAAESYGPDAVSARMAQALDVGATVSRWSDCAARSAEQAEIR